MTVSHPFDVWEFLLVFALTLPAIIALTALAVIVGAAIGGRL